ncbi:MAG: hypothetical protein IKE30_01015 [Clostridia bacterium]|nr:hypothetical protein [Clostridia bacterium]
MRKIFGTILIVILVFSMYSGCVLAEKEMIDFSQYSTEELYTLYKAIHAELLERSGDKEPVSVISCTLSEKSSSYYTVDFTIKNNLEISISTITLTVIFADKDGNTVNATYPQEPQRLRPGKTQMIDALCRIDFAPTSVYVDEIGYDDDEGQYHSFYLSNPEEFFIFN